MAPPRKPVQPAALDTAVIGVDPGPWTGVVVLRFNAEGRMTTAPVALEVTATGAVAVITGLLVAEARTVLGYEPFIVSGRSGRSGHAAAGRTTRNICGALEELNAPGGSSGAGQVVVTSQSAGQISEWCNPTRLRAAGVWDLTTRREHARPAACQAIYTASKHAGIPDPLSKRAQRIITDEELIPS